jgi:hypothetical protein
VSRNNGISIIDLGDRNTIPQAKNLPMADASGKSSHDTENVLRQKFDRMVKENPGERASIAGMFRKK